MEGNFCRPSLLPPCKFFLGKLVAWKISVSQFFAENDVAVANAYGSIIGDNEDHVDDSTTKVC